MDRRAFIKALALTGVALKFAPFSMAAGSSLGQRNYIYIYGHGGWDPTSICDPKGDIYYDDDANRGVINNYPVSSIKQAGNIRYAPLLDPSYTGINHMEDFFNNHYGNLRVFNGVDHGTNSHSIGVYTSMSGSPSPAYPVLPAFIAAEYKELVMTYYLGSGYGQTGGLVNATRINKVDDLYKLVEKSPYLSEDLTDFINNKHAENMVDVVEGSLPGAEKEGVLEFLDAHAGSDEIDLLLDYLPNNVSDGTMGQVEIAAAAIAAGLTCTAQVQIGGFDTHGDHDVHHNNALMSYFEVANYMISELERLNLASNTTLVFSSDFGRTPWYNTDNGKDHWLTSSMMVWSKEMVGNKVIGATNNKFSPIPVNPETLELDESSGVTLTPSHIHKAIRDREGLLGSYNDRFFPLSGEVLDLFG
ncbi:DUF1501 domain-containing protein [Agarivorans sp. B2Z047]|uniref:DUF1501 domain-containing protein n=1 Tax=Agarivorans sp. B2Z047 TaxID=2652721 RepID=UPI00128CCC25|nr:DUF1501 domain-containing protein [Agarivorans sp. B2Z047]MPW31987.1 DUF1501 domain-containing protein [Agarivorans sp. B2Z047]UQN40968.1 DUF1501 domain-containing protein [Agarivorans sp. B2Z047]UQN43713.1 DUF1501 domain-containing protein [Agarivorans sp. B2Z047]